MNIAVINIKDLIKYALILGMLLIIVISGGIIIKGREESKSKIHLDEDKSSSFLYYLGLEIPMMLKEDNSEKEAKTENTAQKILERQLALLYNVNEKQEETKQDIEEIAIVENTGDEEPVNDKSIIETNENVETTVIEENNIKAKYTDDENNIQINNQSKYDIKELLANANYELKNKEKVIIYHTHTCESYTPSEAYGYNMTGAYRTTDLSYTVAGVGDELERYLKQYGKTVIHDKTYHDYPSYNGSYNRSLTTLANILNQNPDAEVAIDLHRDAVRKYKYVWT